MSVAGLSLGKNLCHAAIRIRPKNVMVVSTMAENMIV